MSGFLERAVPIWNVYAAYRDGKQLLQTFSNTWSNTEGSPWYSRLYAGLFGIVGETIGAGDLQTAWSGEDAAGRKYTLPARLVTGYIGLANLAMVAVGLKAAGGAALKGAGLGTAAAAEKPPVYEANATLEELGRGYGLAQEASAAAQDAVQLQPYGGPGGGHHVPAKSAFTGALGYDVNEALAIPNSELTRLGIRHADITGAQQIGYRAFAESGAPLTWAAVEAVETQALIDSGLQPAMARPAVQRAIQALKNAGVSGPTRIPWGG